MKKLLCLLLCAAICIGCFAGCQEIEELIDEFSSRNTDAVGTGEENPTETAAETQPVEPLPTYDESSDGKSLGFTSFDNLLIDYLKQRGLEDENFAVSPLSFKAALVLAALGAEGDTLQQLLAAMGFASRDAMLDWYADVLKGVDSFDEYFEKNTLADRGGAAYEVVNSVWKNKGLPGEFTEEYLTQASELLRAFCDDASPERLTNAINSWINEKTHGLIPALIEDASEASVVLVNALYLKAAWETPFSKTGTDVFTTASGDKVDKSFMRVTDRFRYYEDDESQLVVIPLQGGASMVFVLGSDTRLAEKLNRTTYQRVEVTVPMFDIETALDQGELCDFLRSLGCAKPLTPEAEFGAMFTESLCIGDIIQKAKVHIDEDGLEAAAATAVVAYGTTAVQPEAKIFRADRAFSYYIINGGSSPELLFWGQIVN